MNQPSYALICDDHPLVGRGLCELLKEHPLLSSSASTVSENDFFQYVETHGVPSIALVDFWITHEASESLVRRICATWKDLPILMMSADDDPQVQMKCHQWGARGFISKQASADLIRTAITGILEGVAWFAAPNNQAVVSSIRKNQWPLTADELGLTVRQGQILSLILEGLPNKRIAQQLNVAETTVKEHVTGVLQKMNVKTRVEAIAKLKNRSFKTS